MFTTKRTIGYIKATLMGLSALIGVAVFVLIGEVAQLAGPSMLLTYLLAGFSGLLTAFVYAELATTYTKTGGGYNFAQQTLDGYIAFLTGWMIITGNVVAVSLGAKGFSSYANLFLQLEGDHTQLILSLLITYFLIILQFFSAQKSNNLNIILTIIKIIILFSIGLLGLFYIDLDNFTPFFSTGFIPCVQGVSLAYISFYGFQIIANINEEIINPQKNIPRAIFTSLGITAIIYLLLATSLIGLMHKINLQNTTVVLSNLAYYLLGEWGLIMLLLTALLAIITAMNSSILNASRQIYAMGRDNFLPYYLSRIHPRFKSPHFALIAIIIITTLLNVSNTLVWIGHLASSSYLIGLSLVNIALISSRKKHPHKKRPFRVPFNNLLPILGILINVSILFFSEWIVLWQTAIWILISTVVFYLKKHHQTWWQVIRIKIYSILNREKY